MVKEPTQQFGTGQQCRGATTLIILTRAQAEGQQLMLYSRSTSAPSHEKKQCSRAVIAHAGFCAWLFDLRVRHTD